MQVPEIAAKDMVEVVRRWIPSAQIEEQVLNRDYGSWLLRVTAPNIELEFSWGPLSGFGVTNLLADLTDDDNPFAPYEVGLASAQDAEAYLANHLAGQK